ncbi:MAG: restriction endonuclease subunit S [Thermoguttaceae bacterium]|nr:restriction endonuclease subunit S [Thermoguttaceae bacterium]
MTPQELRNSILQLAIQGKLVEQRPEEGTAEELYREIQFVQIKNLKPIDENEIPFEIPQTWKWLRHNELFEIIGGSQPPKAKFISAPKDGYIRLYQTRDYGKNPIPVYVPINTVSKFTKKGDILLARYGGSLGKVFWAEEGAYNVALARVSLLFSNLVVYSKYLYFYYLAPIYQKFVHTHSRSAQAGFNKEDLNSMLFPLPPLSEQKRIVAKIEELLPYVERYEELWNRLGELDKRFPGDLQKSVLQLAIQGKLVKQRPDEGTAEELYREIQREKQRLVKEGKIKKEKSLPEIKEDEIPFEIPDGWKWVRLGDIIRITSGNGLTSTNMKEGPIPVYGGNGITGYHNESFIHEETVVIGRVGYYCGSVHVTEKEAWVTDNAFITTYPKRFIYRDYLVYVLRHMKLGKMNNATAQPVVSGKKIYPLLFPLPPLSEQKRIVAKIEELLPLCGRLAQINA